MDRRFDLKRIALATLLAFTAAVRLPVATLAQTPAPTSPLAIPIVGSGGGAVFKLTVSRPRSTVRPAW